MSDVLRLRKEITSFSKAERFDTYSKIIINVSDDLCYEAGDSTGRTLTLSCPWGTQAMADNLLAQMRGFAYQPFTAEGAILDPAAELGDGINVNGIYSGIYSIDTTFNSHCSATISAPVDEEVNYGFPYESKQSREIKRQNKKFSSQLTVHSDQIAAEVEQRKNDVETLTGKLTVQSDKIAAEVKQREEDVADLSAKLNVQADQITAEVKERKDDVKTLTGTLDVQADQIVAKVNKTEGSSSTFGWALETASWRIFAGSSTVLKATKDGLEVKGKITATSGTIGGFTINSNHISYQDQTWGGDVANGIYIGISGIQLGKNFKVDNAGNLYAYSGTFEGDVNAGNIRYGGDYGTVSGLVVTENTLPGSGLVPSTITTIQTSSGINSSLGWADFANGVFNGWNTAPTVQCAKLMCSGLASMQDIFLDGKAVERASTTVATPDGGTMTLNYLKWEE